MRFSLTCHFPTDFFSPDEKRLYCAHRRSRHRVRQMGAEARLGHLRAGALGSSSNLTSISH